MSEMVERVTKALHDSYFYPGYESPETDIRWLRDLAISAIKAMREPTAEMVLAFLDAKDAHPKTYYQAMIGAALGEQKDG